MHKLLAIIKAVFEHKASIESVGKSPVSISPVDVTQMGHN
jgi:hypothetical protein